ncbi:MAG: F0F1 ATP synthase subunit A [Planctomycetota bacterium]|nr:F0F1 ATP synthase subunit A [Planctomycetota bacterium]
MKLLRLLPLLALLLALLPALPAQTGPDGGASAVAEAQDPQGGEHGEHQGPTNTLEMSDEEFFVENFKHLVPHKMHGFLGEWEFYNVNLWQLFAVVLILLIFSVVKGSFGGGVSSGFVRVFRGWCHWLRDELIYPVMGKEAGRRWAPFFMYLFFFIAFMNLLGLLPVIGVTATASFYVTGGLAWAVIFVCMLLFGMLKQGPVKFFVNLLPHGMPMALIPLMAVVELVGLFIKPFALMVRLFANMLGGHMVVYSFLGMIFLFAKMLSGEGATEISTGLAFVTAVPAVGMGVFIMIIEGFIALLQAYIFTYLSVIFIQQSMHPAH